MMNKKMISAESGVEWYKPDEFFAPSPEKQEGTGWFCLYTRPRHEKSLARSCREYDIAFYLPLSRRVHHYASGRKVRWLPLFPGYVFCCSGGQEKGRLCGEENLLSVIEVYDPVQFLEELGAVRLALQVSRKLETVPAIQKGQRVEILRGPFKGIVGTVARVKNGYRVFLNMHFVGRSVPLDLDVADVQPVGESALQEAPAK